MNPIESLRSKAVITTFRKLQDVQGKGCGKRRGPPGPEHIEFECTTRDNCRIVGWSFIEPGRRGGTLIHLHGIGSSCVALDLALRLRRMRTAAPTLSTVAIDLRCHGRSGDFPPTLGIAETWDIEAVITHLQQNDFPEPFILMGESMGAMVAAVAVIFEPRISASICIMPPAAPLVGMQIIPKALRSTLISAVNDFYAYDVPGADGKTSHRYNILLDGDLTFHDCSPVHKPRILYVMGDRDEYGWEASKRVWDHLYKGEEAVFDVNRSAAPNQSKWFRLASGFGHDLHKWDQLDPVIHDFLKYELNQPSS